MSREELVIKEQQKMIRALSDELMAGPRIRELQQEDIDAVHGECFRDGESTWCLTHVARYRWKAARCDDWQDFQFTVETVIDRLKGAEVSTKKRSMTQEEAAIIWRGFNHGELDDQDLMAIADDFRAWVAESNTLSAQGVRHLRRERFAKRLAEMKVEFLKDREGAGGSTVELAFEWASMTEDLIALLNGED